MFEELKALILLRNPTMPESYLLESFIGGLKPAIKTLVRAFKPQTLDLAIEQARYQEEHIQALKLPPDRPYKTSYNSVNSKPLLPTPPPNQRLTQPSFSRKTLASPSAFKPLNPNYHKPTRFIPAAERAEKIG